MSQGSFGYAQLQLVLAQWPQIPPDGRPVDGVFARIQQILAAALTQGRMMYPADIRPLLRQVLRRQSLQSGSPAQFAVPRADGWPSTDRWASSGITIIAVHDGHFVIAASPWSPAWLPDVDRPVFESAFSERRVRKTTECPMDPFLSEASGFSTYVSAGQREAVRSAFFSPPGSTLVVNLPTGSGKSLVGQAPVLVGGLEAGLTLFIVPTTGLALDQARQMERLLRHRHGKAKLPILAWRSDLSSEDKSSIKAAIREGRQGIIYCSPEAATGALQPALFDAARAGLIKHLIVDEAHLIGQWGDEFRPAFQALAGLRRGLKRACPGEPFSTILMSATLTPETLQTVDAIFGPAADVQLVAAVHVRPEPEYWIHKASDAADKQRKVLEALRHAPRPFVLYVTTKKDAREWLQRLTLEGFQRVACFHGETPDQQRQDIIDQWSRDALDGVVATSAFGVGIDKADVRTVIHATVPETLDRFYQEVGRGGRDGRCSSSLLIYVDQDIKLARGLGSPTLVSQEIGFERWVAMHESRREVEGDPGMIRVDLTVVPERLKQQTDYNEAWNMRTLILMARAGLLSLEAMPPTLVERQEDESEASFEARQEEAWRAYYSWTAIRILDPAHRNREHFEKRIAGERTRSTNSSSKNEKLLEHLLRQDGEISALFAGLYTNMSPGRTVTVSKACGGCRQHREQNTTSLDYSSPVAQGISSVRSRPSTEWHQRFPWLNTYEPVLIFFPTLADRLPFDGVLSDLVSLFDIQEVSASKAFRQTSDALRTLHSRSLDGVLVLRSLEEDRINPPRMPLPRATIWDSADPIPHPIFELERPVHAILALETVGDPLHPQRALIDTYKNHLTLEQFHRGARV